MKWVVLFSILSAFRTLLTQVPLPAYQAGAEKKFDARLWEAYKEANARFADAVLEVWSAGPPNENDSTATAKVPDYVWVHDYHLMRLPLELRRRDARVSVAWFLAVWKSISAPRPWFRPKLGHDLREIRSTVSREQHLAQTPRDPELKDA